MKKGDYPEIEKKIAMVSIKWTSLDLFQVPFNIENVIRKMLCLVPLFNELAKLNIDHISQWNGCNDTDTNLVRFLHVG